MAEEPGADDQDKGEPTSPAENATAPLADEGAKEPDDVDEDEQPPVRLATPAPDLSRQISQHVLAPLQSTLEALRAQMTANLPNPLAPLEQQLAAIARNVLANIEWPTFQYTLPTGLLENLTGMWDRVLPPNWPKAEKVGPTVDVVRQDGLPLVWVPRASIVTAVVQAPDRPARIEILLARQEDVLQDCDQVLDTIATPIRHGDLVLARQAVQALREGHDGAAQALVAAVLESTIADQIATPSKVRGRVQFDDRIALVELRLRVALAPLEPYFRHFTPGKTPEEQRPSGPNRHLTVHVTTPEHLSPANALVSVMLLVSVLRALQDLPALRARDVDLSWLMK